MGISFSHLIVIFLILMLLFGAQRLEGIGLSLGKAVRGFKKGLEGEFDDEVIVTKKTTTEKVVVPDPTHTPPTQS